jgi:hypothetical protein
VAASQAQAQVQPTVTHFQTFFAAFGFRFDFADLVEVSTGIGHAGSFASRRANHIAA